MNTPSQSDLDLARTIGKIEGTLESLVRSVADLRGEIAEQHKPLAARVAKLEQWKAWTLGAAAAAGSVASVIAPKIAGVFP